MAKDFLIPKGYSEDIIIKKDDFSLVNSGQRFINVLETEYKKHWEIINSYKKKNNIENYFEGESAFFKPEILTRLSPMTIMDAPWGSGKTYFIEELAKNFENKKVTSNIFKNIIILDVWKYSNSKDVAEEIMSELFYILASRNNSLKLQLKKIAKWLFDTSGRPWIYRLGIDMPYVEEKPDKYRNLLRKVNSQIEKTIIFFDNIERIGEESWEAIKAIMKLSEFESFVFVLPMNLKKLQLNDKMIEYPIEKYIDIKIFNLKQDYTGLLKKMNFGDSVENINLILDNEIDGQKLSIREVEQRLRKMPDSFADLNIFEILKKITNEVWGSKEIAISILKNKDCSISYFFENLNKKISLINKLKDKIKEWNSTGFLQKLLSENKKLDNALKQYINKWKDFNYFENENIEFTKCFLNSILNKIQKEEEKIASLRNEESECVKNLKKAKNDVQEFKKQIEKLNKELEKIIKNLEKDGNLKEKQHIESAIEEGEITQKEKSKEVSSLEDKLKNIKNQKEELNNIFEELEIKKRELEYLLIIMLNVEEEIEGSDLLKLINVASKEIFNKYKIKKYDENKLIDILSHHLLDYDIKKS